MASIQPQIDCVGIDVLLSKDYSLSVVKACGGGDEGRCQQRRPGTQIVEAEGRNRVHDAGRQARKGGVKEAITGSNVASAKWQGEAQPQHDFSRATLQRSEAGGRNLQRGRAASLPGTGKATNLKERQKTCALISICLYNL
jgi:hypothetical protein